jgi:chromate transport protein ChrA
VSEYLIGLLPIVLFGGLFAILILLSSAFRHTPPRAGFLALAYSVVIWIVAAFVGGSAGGSSASGAYALTGIVLTTILLMNAKYKWGLSWLLFLLGPIGWFLLLWRSNNQKDARRRAAIEESATASAVT